MLFYFKYRKIIILLHQINYYISQAINICCLPIKIFGVSICLIGVHSFLIFMWVYDDEDDPFRPNPLGFLRVRVRPASGGDADWRALGHPCV
jgi:hypothetical protein